MPKYNDEIKRQAQVLHVGGMSLTAISRQLGVSRPTVSEWVNPEVVERNRERARKWKQKNAQLSRKISQRWKQANRDRTRKINRQWYHKNTERSRASSNRWRSENRERDRQISKQWRQKNRERLRAAARDRYQEDPTPIREKNAFRRAAKRQATPPWLTDKHRKQMRTLHTEARRLGKTTGIPHHVDHIVPLVAKWGHIGSQIACGLHVPWNLRVLAGPENCSKNCKLPVPEEWLAT